MSHQRHVLWDVGENAGKEIAKSIFIFFPYHSSCPMNVGSDHAYASAKKIPRLPYDIS